MLVNSSVIVSIATRPPGLVLSRALSHAVIACAKADQYKEVLNLIELHGMWVVDDDQSIACPGAGSVSIKEIQVISACGRYSRPNLAFQILNNIASMYDVNPDKASY